MWDAISAWVVVAAERSVATSDELKNSEGWDAAIRADNRASKVPPDGGLPVSGLFRPGAPLLRKRRPFPARRALPDQEGGTPVEQGPYGGSQGWFNVGTRLRALSARAVGSLAPARSIATLAAWTTIATSETRTRAKAARPRTRSTARRRPTSPSAPTPSRLVGRRSAKARSAKASSSRPSKRVVRTARE